MTTAWRTTEAVAGRYYDADGRPVGADGRPLLRHLSTVKLLGAGRALEAFGGRVPAAHLDEEVTDGEYFAVVRCVCGAEPSLHLGTVKLCEGECGRAFLYAGSPGFHGRRRVLVARLDLDCLDDESLDGRS